MKAKETKLLILIFILSIPVITNAQIRLRVEEKYSGIPEFQINKNKICLGDSAIINIRNINYTRTSPSPYIQFNRPPSIYNIVFGYPYCWFILSKTLATFNISGNNITTNIPLESLVSCANFGDIQLIAKPKETTSYSISWSAKTTYPENYPIWAGGYDIISEEYTHIGIFTIEVVNLPPKANLVVDKSLAEVNDDVIFSAEGCPVSTAETPVKYQFAHAFSCDGVNIEYDEDDYYTFEKTRLFRSPTPTKEYVKVRCKVGECVGEYSEPISVRIIEQPNVPSPNCNLGEVDESGYFPRRSDYHRYQLAKEICDKSTDQDCTVENVFNLLKSQQKNSIPQYKDFPPEAFAFMSGAIVSSGLQNQYYYSNVPTANCQQTGVYSPFSSYFLVKSIAPCISIGNGGYFWDPITQFIDNTSHTITNFTLPGHTLHPGKIMLSIKEDNCKIIGQVIGMGNSSMYDCLPALGNYLSKTLNVNIGLKIFDKVLDRVKILYDSKTWK